MKFHALLPVRDEADIIQQSLAHLVTWADAVYVFDTGSCDQTWELVCQFATKDCRVLPLRRDPVFFSDKRVRAWLFHQARRYMLEGDWFLRVDADEFHHVNPRDFVRAHMRPHETVAFHQYYDFHLTRSEADAWCSGKETMLDRKRPISERRRSYTISSYTEPRLCRYRQSMRWPENVSFPFNGGYTAVERLPIRHYPHRDPAQLQRRCCVRAMMMAEPDNTCAQHWNATDWRQFIYPDHAGGLQYWEPGAELPDPQSREHLAGMPKRALQRLCHACCLPLLDKLRAGYSDRCYPHRLPPQLRTRLNQELAALLPEPATEG
ncbi:MAG TPA: glycosyltransferase family 2 protein [Verrucomicrobiae bacterium]|nr:glycosyltransferase family 2 protein [Verrucomicrobiae bacterium]